MFLGEIGADDGCDGGSCIMMDCLERKFGEAVSSRLLTDTLDSCRDAS